LPYRGQRSDVSSRVIASSRKQDQGYRSSNPPAQPASPVSRCGSIEGPERPHSGLLASCAVSQIPGFKRRLPNGRSVSRALLGNSCFGEPRTRDSVRCDCAVHVAFNRQTTHEIVTRVHISPLMEYSWRPQSSASVG